jgi:hypothetical protein
MGIEPINTKYVFTMHTPYNDNNLLRSLIVFLAVLSLVTL